MIPFIKMHGIGNDYLYVDARKLNRSDWSKLAVEMSLPHFGCGSDGLILILNSDQADFRFRIFNNDGSEAAMCGNGLRCVAKYCHDMGLTEQTEFLIETASGLKRVQLTLDEKGRTRLIKADMGQPELQGEKIPSRLHGNPVIAHRISFEGKNYLCTLVNMGNPHAVCFVENPDSIKLSSVGHYIEFHPDFPERINVEFVQVLDRGHIRLRVWERGSGETLACGTGACASVVAAVLNGFTERVVQVDLPGGMLNITWDEESGLVYQEGAAAFVYAGQWLETEEDLSLSFQ